MQRGWADDMLRDADELVSYISQWFTLRTGDLLFTGTPEGAGPVAIGDHVEGWINDRKVLEFNIR